MSTFNPGDVVVHSTWCGPSVVQIASGSDDGLIIRTRNGHTDYWPTSQHIGLGDMLDKFRHATPDEREKFLAGLPAVPPYGNDD